jgi:hypothetical protein
MPRAIMFLGGGRSRCPPSPYPHFPRGLRQLPLLQVARSEAGSCHQATDLEVLTMRKHLLMWQPRGAEQLHHRQRQPADPVRPGGRRRCWCRSGVVRGPAGVPEPALVQQLAGLERARPGWASRTAPHCVRNSSGTRHGPRPERPFFTPVYRAGGAPCDGFTWSSSWSL